eukprot:3732792-Pyramimonas_sp.AAC.1
MEEATSDYAGKMHKEFSAWKQTSESWVEGEFLQRRLKVNSTANGNKLLKAIQQQFYSPNGGVRRNDACLLRTASFVHVRCMRPDCATTDDANKRSYRYKSSATRSCNTVDSVAFVQFRAAWCEAAHLLIPCATECCRVAKYGVRHKVRAPCAARMSGTYIYDSYGTALQ